MKLARIQLILDIAKVMETQCEPDMYHIQWNQRAEVEGHKECDLTTLKMQRLRRAGLRY